MLSFKDSNIYIEGQGIVRSDLVMNEGKFTSFNAKEGITLLNHLLIVPGFIDEHMHGANGSDVMDANLNSIHNIATSICKDGVTSFLPTTMTMEKEKIILALKTIEEFKKNQKEGASILGVHLEGPFISKDYKGAQDEKFIEKPTIKAIKEYLDSVPNLIKIITLAYEECDEDVVPYLVNQGIIVSIGHSGCSNDLLKKGFNQGISLSTHTFNAMKGIHHRDIGIPGCVMLHDNVNAELICDLYHVSADAITLLYKMKGKDHLILITDSMEARFLNDGLYHLGGQEVYVKNHTARLKDNTLAGSILNMNQALANVKKTLGINLTSAIDMGSINPARNLKIDQQKGSIALGKDADFVIIDENFNVYATFVNGKLAYQGGQYEK